ncbi:MAG: molecular chaperone HtpG [Alphaproteobacteria bacterium]
MAQKKSQKSQKSTKAKSSKKPGKAQPHEFGADVSRLLEILVHSVYADAQVFLRELVSNASDACDRLRYEAITDPALLGDDPDLRILITADAKAGTLAISDNGIGMSHDELIANLGTIARSGTRAFVASAEEASAKAVKAAKGGKSKDPKAARGIGQFGVGFYSAFMVAAQVSVASRRAGATDCWVWKSAGLGAFTVEAAEPGDDNPARGTTITLTIRDDHKELLSASRLTSVVKAHSDHVSFPIDICEIVDGKTGGPTRANAASALWTRPKAEVSAEQYKEFYGSLSGQFDEPAITLHYRAEGRHDYSVLVFVPGAPPFDLFEPARKSGIKLYVSRVLISDDAQLLPPYLRFVHGVVDSQDMPLTVSRDMLQKNPIAASIAKALTNRVIGALKKQADKEQDAYEAVWKNFGAVLKEGLYEDYAHRDDLLALLRCRSTAGEGWRSLADYIADKKENQTAIYYITGEDSDQLARSPHLEAFAARGLEVLLFTDPVDNFWTQMVMGFEGKPFVSVTQGALDLENIAKVDDEADPDDRDEKSEPVRDADLGALVAFVKQTLGEVISDVRLSDRLVRSPACLVASDTGLDRGMERIMAERRGSTRQAPVLEINPGHPITANLAAKIVAGGNPLVGDALAKDTAWTLFDYAKIADGEAPHDASAFAQRLAALVEANLEQKTKD